MKYILTDPTPGLPLAAKPEITMVQTLGLYGICPQPIDKNFACHQTFKIGDDLIVPPLSALQPMEVEGIFNRNPFARVAFCPHAAHLDLVKEIFATVAASALCVAFDKAVKLASEGTAGELALAINDTNPECLVLVAGTRGAAAAQWGQAVSVPAPMEISRPPRFSETRFFAGFLAEFYRSGGLALSLAAGLKHSATHAHWMPGHDARPAFAGNDLNRFNV